MNKKPGVYVPQYTPLSAGGAYICGNPEVVAPGQKLKFAGCGDSLNAFLEPDGLTVTQAGLYLINFSAELSGEAVKLILTAGGADIPGAEFGGGTVSASFIRRLAPDSEICAVNRSGGDVTVRSASLTAVQLAEYCVSGFEYSPNEPI